MRDRNNRGVPVKENYTGKTVAANLFRGIEAVGGKLVFEENGMTFKSHKLNVQTGETTILYNDIVEVRKANSMGIIPNGMIVVTKEGQQYKFVVNQRNKIVDFLEQSREVRPQG